MAKEPKNQPRQQPQVDEGAEPREDFPIHRAPDSQFPVDPDKPLGETSQNPLGVDKGTQGNFYNDPTDNRAIGKQSQGGVNIDQEEAAETQERRHGLPEGVISRERETESPSRAMRESVLLAPLAPVAPAEIRARKVEFAEGETVELTAPHYLNDVLYETGTILEDYTGPKSKNMRPVQEGQDYSKAREMQRKLERGQTSFRTRQR